MGTPQPKTEWVFAWRHSSPHFSQKKVFPFLAQRNVDKNHILEILRNPDAPSSSALTPAREKKTASLPAETSARKKWLEELIGNWIRNTQDPKAFLTRANVLAKLMADGATEQEFCDFIRAISCAFYQCNRGGVEEEAEGIYREMRAKFLRGRFNPFSELVVYPTFCCLSGGMRALFSLYREEAARENLDVVAALAGISMQGWEPGSKDAVEALRLYKLAASHGHPEALFILGKMCQEEATEGKAIEAAVYYKQAADRGNKEAQMYYAHFLLGRPSSYMEIDCEEYSYLFYRKKIPNNLWLFSKNNVQPHHVTASSYKKSAEKGNYFAQCVFAHCCEIGIGMSQNIDEAIQWYEKSALFDYQEAKEALNRIRSKKAREISSARNAPPDPLQGTAEREKKFIALAGEWKNNLGMFGNIERNGQILVTLFQKN
jgi:TPR repeat protein